MLTIFKKEFKNYFGSYAAYLVAAIFVLITTLFLWFFDNEFNVFNLGEASLSTFFFIAPWAFLFLIPALTMRQFAEERQLGTLEWLFTQPIRISNIVLGKYLSVLILILFMLVPTVIYIFTLAHFSLDGQVDYGTIFSGYLGLYLLGALFAAIGICVSSFTSNQVVAYVAAVFSCFVLYYGFQGIASYNLLGGIDYYMQQFGAQFHYNSFLKGIVDTRDLFYFITIAALALVITQISIQKISSK
ncbi:ABC transporter permease subunit [Flavobacteriaceae bacterium Ap0902]|nr:ABC transporter permease subunit [Flavobacteriaceae bacterium Ap0902]